MEWTIIVLFKGEIYEIEDGFTDVRILDKDIQGKEVFLTGEMHGNKANNELKMKFLKYFKALL